MGEVSVLEPRHGNGEQRQPTLDKMIVRVALRSESVDEVEGDMSVGLCHPYYGGEEDGWVEIVEVVGDLE